MTLRKNLQKRSVVHSLRYDVIYLSQLQTRPSNAKVNKHSHDACYDCRSELRGFQVRFIYIIFLDFDRKELRSSFPKTLKLQNSKLTLSTNLEAEKKQTQSSNRRTHCLPSLMDHDSRKHLVIQDPKPEDTWASWHLRWNFCSKWRGSILSDPSYDNINSPSIMYDQCSLPITQKFENSFNEPTWFLKDFSHKNWTKSKFRILCIRDE